MAIDRKRRERIAGKLRAHRAERGYSQKQVEEACDMNKTRLGTYERGMAGITYEKAWDLADLYGVTLDELGGREAPVSAGDAD